MSKKVYKDAHSALTDVKDGMTLVVADLVCAEFLKTASRHFTRWELKISLVFQTMLEWMILA